MATEGIVRPGLSAGDGATLAFARRHRFHLLEGVPWAAAIAAFVLVEKTAPFGAWSQRVAGALLVTLGVLTLAGSIAS